MKSPRSDVSTQGTSAPPGTICIVTPDLVGPVRNGGIGTHASNLAWRLAAAGHCVEVIFTGPFETGTADHWRRSYAAAGVRLVCLADIVGADDHLSLDPVLAHSYRVLAYLRGRDYAAILFQDWRANGFFAIRAKRTLGWFASSRLVVTLHSPTEWIASGSHSWFARPVDDAKLAWAERYCARHADTVVSPSRHMLEWCRTHGWTLADDQRVIPYCLLSDEQGAEYEPAPGVIAFFGRLETRKGLDLFVPALLALAPAIRQRLRKVLFVGKSGRVGDEQGQRYIKRMLAASGIPFQVHDGLDSAAALDLIERERAVAFAPSVLDNLPFVVIECCTRGIPILAARTGGIGELLADDRLFAPSVPAVAAAIERAQTAPLPPAPARYRSDAAFLEWQAVCSEALPPAARERSAADDEVAREGTSSPQISVCIAHYNHGPYLLEALASLDAQTFRDFEVVVMDDGSSQAQSREIFDSLPARFHPPRFRFERQDNAGVAAARNAAAARARGRFLLFMDADNVAMPHMLADFHAAIVRTGDDVLTCHYDAVAETGDVRTAPPMFRYVPIGACLEVGWLENVFGDANFLVRRDVFAAAGGFGEDRATSWEDWELLARLSLGGSRLDVVPRSLFWYRYTQQGFSRSTSRYRNYRRVLATYAAHMPENLRPILTNVIVPIASGDAGPRAMIAIMLRAMARRWPRAAGRVRSLRTALGRARSLRHGWKLSK